MPTAPVVGHLAIEGSACSEIGLVGSKRRQLRKTRMDSDVTKVTSSGPYSLEEATEHRTMGAFG